MIDSVKRAFRGFLFRYQEEVFRVLNVVSFFVSLFSLFFIGYYYGFDDPRLTPRVVLAVVKVLLFFFVGNYLIRLLMSANRWEFIIDRWFDGLLTLIFIYDLISLYWLGQPLFQTIFEQLGMRTFTPLYIFFVNLYLLFFVGSEFVRFSAYLPQLAISPPLLMLLSFVMLILVGTGLLMLPEMTAPAGSMPLVDALFTATSASCVTGLIVVDTATYFTFKGQLVILMLMQIGGISIISFAFFFASMTRSGLGLAHQLSIKEVLNLPTLRMTHLILRKVVLITLGIEAVIAALIYGIVSGMHLPISEPVFFSIFHGVSAFCNAGFSTLTDGLHHVAVRHVYVLHLIIALGIIIGGLGFWTLLDIGTPSRVRERIRFPWKDWDINSKIAVYTSLMLIAAGAVVFWISERHGVMADADALGRWTMAFFQSVTTRTAGFNTVDFSALSPPFLLLATLLMFIGASSGSTGGGIKTSTFWIVFVTVFSYIRGKRQVEIGRYSLTMAQINRAFAILLFAAGFIMVATLALTFTEAGHDPFSLLFEEVSAFCTVGLSLGLTPTLSTAGKLIITVSMLVGRVGILSFAVLLLTRRRQVRRRLPEGHFIIG